MTHKRYFLCIFLMLNAAAIFAQTPIQVADLSFKLNGNTAEEFYYSFAEGDIMVVDFELAKGKGVQFEIVELPNQIKTSQFTAKMTDYRLNVFSTKVYLFRITNGLGNKMCSLHIKRIPKSQETLKFNTGWEWKTLYDTTYNHYSEDSLVGHDTVHYMETIKEVDSREVSEEMLFDRKEEIPSIAKMILDENPRKCITFHLPQNIENTYLRKTVIGWGFWICVGDHSSSWWSKNKNLMIKGASTIAGTTMSPLGAFVAGEITNLLIPDKGAVDNVIWAVISNWNDRNAFVNGERAYCMQTGNGPGAWGKFLDAKDTQGTYHICLRNDNTIGKIRVNVKVSVLVETITYKDVDYPRTRIVPQYVKVPKVRRNITSRQIRVPVNEGR